MTLAEFIKCLLGTGTLLICTFLTGNVVVINENIFTNFFAITAHGSLSYRLDNSLINSDHSHSARFWQRIAYTVYM